MLKKLVLPDNTKKDKLSMTAEMLQLMTEDIVKIGKIANIKNIVINYYYRCKENVYTDVIKLIREEIVYNLTVYFYRTKYYTGMDDVYILTHNQDKDILIYVTKLY